MIKNLLGQLSLLSVVQVISTLIPLLMQREGQPRLSRPVLWGLLAAGVVAFLSGLAVRIARGG